MNPKTFLSLLLVSPLVLTSCKKELEPQESSPSTEIQSTVPETANPTAASGTTPPQMQQSAPVTNSNTITPVPVASTVKGMNPAHGQPGHRCDIPVGAPLNSPIAKTTSTQPATTLTQPGTSSVKITPAVMGSDGKLTPGSSTTTTTPGTPVLLNTPATTTAPGMNPPHGQEGHRCDVSVGAPLPKS